jgi:ubiquinone biosynthesis protein UbiJ
MLALLQEAVLLKISKIINDILENLIYADNNFAKKLLRLDGKVIKLEIKNNLLDFIGLFSTIYFISVTNGLFVLSTENYKPDLTVKITLNGVIKAGVTNIEQAIRDNDIEFDGNLNLAMDLQSLLNTTEIDFLTVLQEKLAIATSDVFAWQFVNFFKIFIHNFNIKIDELKEQVKDYLQLESNLLVSKSEVDDFCKQVDVLSNDLARLNAKIELLVSKVQLS